MRWLREIVALAAIGAGIFAIGVWVSWRGWYLIGLVAGAIGLGALAVIIIARLLASRWARWVIGGGLALVLVGVGLAVPQVLVGRPDSRPLWQTTGAAPTARLVGGRLYLHSDYTDQLLDPGTGRILASAPAQSYGLTVGADGSFVQRGRGVVVYRGPDGQQRWRLAANKSVTVLAIANGWVVMRGCAKDQDVVCGIGPNGKVGWQEELGDDVSWLGTIGWERQYSSSDEAEPLGQAAVELAARVAVRVTHLQSGELYSVSHQRLGGLTGRPLAVGGDLVVTVAGAGAQSGAQCRFVGTRGTEQVFRSPPFECADVTLSGSFLMLDTRMYFLGRGQPAGGWQLDLRSGRLRRTTPVATDSGDPRSLSDLAFPSHDVIARQRGKTVTGLDPDTGNQLWSHTADSDGLPGVSAANGAVTVLSRLSDRAAALAGLDPKDSPKLITVLDARTGKVTGHRILTAGLGEADGIWNDYGIGPGRALIMINRGDVYAIGADS